MTPPCDASAQDLPRDDRGFDGTVAAAVVAATPRAGPVEIDGRLDEAAWAKAPASSEFVAGEPVEGVRARDQTEVRVLFDDEAVYVGLRMFDSRPASIRTQLTRRDEESESYDYVEVAFDPDLDRRSAYAFRLTAAGVQVDRYRYDDVEVDGAWQAVWEGATRVDERGWTAEFRIPLSQLRYDPSSEPQAWGLNVTRRNVSTGEVSYLALESRRRYGGVSAFTRLEGILLPDRSRSLEVRPFVLAGHRGATEASDDPFRDGAERSIQVGGDGRYGLGSTFVADFTVNPDFGQVEVDPAVINLTAFETFFPEQRPFFTRDDRLFDFSLPGPQNTLFYSRRIGRSPQGPSPEGADFVHVAGETPILAAGKVTGRTAGGLGLGALFALTDQVRGRAYFDEEDRFEQFAAEPRARYGVLRARQDLREGGSQVGGVVTHVSRDLPGGGPADHFPSSAHTFGVDFEHSWRDREWYASGHLTASHVRGSPEAMVRLQRSSTHYFQRPDAAHLGVDSTASALTGAHWHVNLGRRGGSRWTGSTWLGHRTPGFEVNDLGFSSSPERFYGGNRVAFQEIEPGRLFREYSLSLFTVTQWRNSLFSSAVAEDRLRDSWAGGRSTLSADFTFLNYWSLELGAQYVPPSLDDRATRGGPFMRTSTEWSWSAGLASDPRAKLSATAEVEFETAGDRGNEVEIAAGVSYRPSASIQFEVTPTFARARDRAQYVTRMVDGSYEPTMGDRYFFADLDSRTLSLDTRLSLVVSPTLTLEVFTQPLLSSGDYLGYRQFARARTFDFVDFPEGEAVANGDEVRCVGGASCALGGRRFLDLDGDGRADFHFPEQSFNIRSLRGNAVLRWEYRPGSQLYLVWQQQRRDEATFGDFVLERDARALLRTPAENVFMLKVNYWLGI